MKASSVGWEIFVDVSDKEIALLENHSLEGKIRVHDREKKIGEFYLEIKVGNIDRRQLFAELTTEPDHVYIDSVHKYYITLSKEGYENLKDNGATGDRMANNPGCKVMIKNPAIYGRY